MFYSNVIIPLAGDLDTWRRFAAVMVLMFVLCTKLRIILIIIHLHWLVPDNGAVLIVSLELRGR